MVLVVAALILWFRNLIDARYRVPSWTQNPTGYQFREQPACGFGKKRGEPRDEGIPNKDVFRHLSGFPFGFHDVQCRTMNAGQSLLL